MTRMNVILKRLKEFMVNEARSCSMDFGYITPEYVYRMWGGSVSVNEIEEVFKVCGSRLMIKG